jgi:hypothetical protein
MAFVVKDRVKETTTTAGTGIITLAGAVNGYQTFSVIGDGNTTFYTIAGQGTSEWEVGIGTYTSSGTTLSRDTVLSSSNSGALVNFSAGTKDVFITYTSQLVPIIQVATKIGTKVVLFQDCKAKSPSPLSLVNAGSVQVPGGLIWTISPNFP